MGKAKKVTPIRNKQREDGPKASMVVSALLHGSFANKLEESKQIQDDTVLSDIISNIDSNIVTSIKPSIEPSIEPGIEPKALSNIAANIEPNIESVLANLENSVGEDNLYYKKHHQSLKKKIESEGTSSEEVLPQSVQQMALWHTATEQQVYIAMYKDTVMHRRKEGHFSYKELCSVTGIRSAITIGKGVKGLLEKQSIEIVSKVHGNNYGARFRVFRPREILERRRIAQIRIDYKTKLML